MQFLSNPSKTTVDESTSHPPPPPEQEFTSNSFATDSSGVESGHEGGETTSGPATLDGTRDPSLPDARTDDAVDDEEDDDNVPSMSRSATETTVASATAVVTYPRDVDAAGNDPGLATTRHSLQAVIHGEREVHVRIKVNNEIITEDQVEVSREMERSLSSSTNTSTDQEQRITDMEQYSRPEDEEHHQHHHKHRTRSSSFDIAHAMVHSTANNHNNNNNINDQETNTSSSSHNNSNNSNNSNRPPALNDFADASLLLGLTESQSHSSHPSPKPARGELEPATLPSAMTLFLDMLNEEQRRVRHRHIPAVEGFRKLYKSEIKHDLTAARALLGRQLQQQQQQRSGKGKRGGVEEGTSTTMMDVEEEEKDGAMLSDNEVLADFSSSKADGGKSADTPPESHAFVAPSENTIAFAHCGQLASLMESTPFENSMRGGISAGSLRSPQLVESLTAFNPPRPQESSAMKTKHRLKRWENNPQDVEVDLLNYKKTVQRTRMELHKAEVEHAQIEAVASMIRNHFMNHLNAYREEIAVIGEQLHGTRSKCFKAAEQYNGKTMSTRGSSKTMKDVFTTLKNLGDDLEAKGMGGGGKASSAPDWRVSGLGGIAAFADDIASKGSSATSSLANGWILFGDKVKTTSGEEGTVVRFYGPSFQKMPPSEVSLKKDPPEKEGDSHAMDIDQAKNAADTTSAKETPTLQDMVVPSGITVHLTTGTVKTFPPSELELVSRNFSCATDAAIAKRWENMTHSAIETGSGHDYLGMNSQVIASILREKQEEENDGSASPKSVTQYDDLRNVIPFGAGLMSAPEQIKNYSSIIPVNTLEESVRKVVYDGGKAVPPSVEKYESQKEKLNRLKIKVLQLRNRLSRQKKIRILNERSLKAGENRAERVEGLLMEMQADLRCLKERLQDELNELGMGNGCDTNTESKNVDQTEQKGDASLPDSRSVEVEGASNLNEQSTTSRGGSDETCDAKAHVMNDKRRFDDLDGSCHDSKRARME
ncbi:hypothetical protein HJC23_010657 [Cyclotella cryptica]|uniref:BZIP domain-containing protein n=1 Tax=Cyclotella cryptica TaxID=29204 RepID=A0ABD3PFF3_9STRA